MPLKYTLEERVAAFWHKVDQSAGDDACWLWTGAVSSSDYGSVGWGRRHTESAHRIAYLLSNGDCPSDLEVCHSCDAPLCCNPKHLFIGTHTDNMQDMFAKKRRQTVCGEQHASHKLTAAKVADIRRRYAAGNISQQKLATEYGVAQPGISAIVLRKIWKHI